MVFLTGYLQFKCWEIQIYAHHKKDYSYLCSTLSKTYTFASYQTGEVNLIELVQKFALRIRMCAKVVLVTKNCCPSQFFSSVRRIYRYFCTMFRIINWLRGFPDDVLVSQTSNTFIRSSNIHLFFRSYVFALHFICASTIRS